MVPITILSPAYNKGKTIRRTFESLLHQTCYDFEWVIINDGSSDNTLDEIRSFKTNKFKIRYYDKPNEGLNRTWNKGINYSNGELIMRVDPDDYLTEDAIETVIKYKYLLNDDNVCSIVFLTKFANGDIVGTNPYPSIHRSNFIDYRIIDKAKGDRMEIVRKSVYAEFPMPEIEGEKFCMESVMQQNIALKYDAYYIPRAIYVREYNESSITSSLTKIMSQNPQGAMLVYSRYIKVLMDRKKKGINVTYELMTNGINFYRYGLYSIKHLSNYSKDIPFLLRLICVIPGVLFFGIDYINPEAINAIVRVLKK